MACYNCQRYIPYQTTQYTCFYCGWSGFINPNINAQYVVSWLDQAPLFFPINFSKPGSTVDNFNPGRSVMTFPTTHYPPINFDPI
jgi:hypothetical protein